MNIVCLRGAGDLDRDELGWDISSSSFVLLVKNACNGFDPARSPSSACPVVLGFRALRFVGGFSLRIWDILLPRLSRCASSRPYLMVTMREIDLSASGFVGRLKVPVFGSNFNTFVGGFLGVWLSCSPSWVTSLGSVDACSWPKGSMMLPALSLSGGVGMSAMVCRIWLLIDSGRLGLVKWAVIVPSVGTLSLFLFFRCFLVTWASCSVEASSVRLFPRLPRVLPASMEVASSRFASESELGIG